MSVAPRECLRVVTPFGIRFADAATDLPIRGGLHVRMRSTDQPGPWHVAREGTSGVYAFHGVRGLRDFEYPSRETAASPPKSEVYVVEIRDLKRRFTPLLFTEELPLEDRGLYAGPVRIGSPPVSIPDAQPHFYLFSASSRSAEPGMAEVRANLVEYDPELDDASKMLPAAHALVEIGYEGTSWFGLSDADGGLAVFFPYPVVNTRLAGSPPSGRTRLRDQQWDLRIRVRYAPQNLEYVDRLELPELRSIVAQSPAVIHTSLPGSPVNMLPSATMSTTLRYGEACVLRSTGQPALCIEGEISSP